MNRKFYNDLADQGLGKTPLARAACEEILGSPDIELLPLLNAAFEVRKKYTGKEVMVHVINNAQNGFCPEDCHYCPQAKSSQADIEEYPLKPDEEIFAEAQKAHEGGAFRYCMVFAGRGPSQRRTEKLAALISEIKRRYPLEVCVSAGLLDDEKAKILKAAGLDRLNHNLNSSAAHYPKICSTHTYQDRLNTLKSAQRAGLEICSGMIVGMGESPSDVIEVAMTLREMKSRSIPVNFLVPIEGNTLQRASELSPDYCLRILCLFRFLNPDAEIRAAAGRELHLRSMEVMALYPANSLFLEGYLNTRGSARAKTLRMIQDAGFTIKSEQNLDELLKGVADPDSPQANDRETIGAVKGWQELRPYFSPDDKK